MATFVRFRGVDGRAKLINLDLVKDFTEVDEHTTNANQVEDDFIALNEKFDVVQEKAEAQRFE